MGLPITLFTKGEIPRKYWGKGSSSRLQPNIQTRQAPLTFPVEWDIRLELEKIDDDFNHLNSYKSNDCWCLWTNMGEKLILINSSGQIKETCLSEYYNFSITCVVMNCNENLIMGMSNGQIAEMDTATHELIWAPHTIRHSISHIWIDGNGIGPGFVVMTDQYETYYMSSISSIPNKYELQTMPTSITNVAMSHNNEYLCISDETNVLIYHWNSRLTPFRNLKISQLNDEKLLSVQWDLNSSMLIMSTPYRLLSYNFHDHWISNITNEEVKHISCLPDGKICLINRYVYDTLVQVYEYVGGGSHWSSSGYCDITTKLNIRDINMTGYINGRLFLFNEDKLTVCKIVPMIF